MSFNKVILVGNMTAAPELKQTQSGESVSSFSIAVNRNFKNKDGNAECDFINIVAWRKQAEFICKFFKKGSPILVCGQLQTRTWHDNQGQKRYATEVIADEVAFVGPATQNEDKPTIPDPSKLQGASYIPQAYTQPKMEESNADQDLPF